MSEALFKSGFKRKRTNAIDDESVNFPVLEYNSKNKTYTVKKWVNQKEDLHEGTGLLHPTVVIAVVGFSEDGKLSMYVADKSDSKFDIDGNDVYFLPYFWEILGKHCIESDGIKIGDNFSCTLLDNEHSFFYKAAIRTLQQEFYQVGKKVRKNQSFENLHFLFHRMDNDKLYNEKGVCIGQNNEITAFYMLFVGDEFVPSTQLKFHAEQKNKFSQTKVKKSYVPKLISFEDLIKGYNAGDKKCFSNALSRFIEQLNIDKSLINKIEKLCE